HHGRRDEGPRAPRLRGAAHAAGRPAGPEGGRMSREHDPLEVVAARPAGAPPPLSAALEAELGGLSPVATRRPVRQLAQLVVLALIYGGGVLALATTRRDAGELPVPWLIGVA